MLNDTILTYLNNVLTLRIIRNAWHSTNMMTIANNITDWRVSSAFCKAAWNIWRYNMRLYKLQLQCNVFLLTIMIIIKGLYDHLRSISNWSIVHAPSPFEHCKYAIVEICQEKQWNESCYSKTCYIWI